MRDTTALIRFFDIMNLETGSADETPAWALGYIFLCESNFTIQMMENNYSKILLDNLEFGILNVTYQKENEIENFEDLKNKLDSLKLVIRNQN